MGCAESRYLGRRRANLNSLRTAVVTDPVHGGVVDGRVVDDGRVHNRAVVHLVHVNIADVIDRAIVSKVVSMPVTALVAASHVAEAIVDAAIKPDISAPVSMEQCISPVAISPVTRRPECAFIRGRGPGAGDPVVAFLAIVPVAGSP